MIMVSPRRRPAGGSGWSSTRAGRPPGLARRPPAPPRPRCCGRRRRGRRWSGIPSRLARRRGWGRQSAGRLLPVLAQYRNRPGAGGQHRVVEAGDLLRAEQDQQRLQGHRGEGGHRHRVTGTVQAGGDHDDAAGEPAGGAPEVGRVHRGHAPTRRGHRPRRPDSTNVSTTPRPALAAPPYRYHLPAVVSVTITLPAGVGMVSTNEARSQPNAGTRAPIGESMPRPASRQVAKTTTQNASAATGTGPTAWRSEERRVGKECRSRWSPYH